LIKEIYNRASSDPNYIYGILEHSSAIESIISKIKMILSTRQGKIIGDHNFGIGIEDLVFETRINKMQLEEKIKQQINMYISESQDYQITPIVGFGKDVGYEYAVIDIYINNAKIIGILVK